MENPRITKENEAIRSIFSTDKTAVKRGQSNLLELPNGSSFAPFPVAKLRETTQINPRQSQENGCRGE